MIRTSHMPLRLYTDLKWRQIIKFGNKKGIQLMKLNDEISEWYLDEILKLNIQRAVSI